MSDVALALRGVSKRFLRYKTPGSRLLGTLGVKLPRSRYDEMWAVHNVDLTVQRGERVGLIGRNGAGKSTLLRLLTGQIKPTSGDVHVFGKLQALMEVGTGFHPDFTGLQNIRTALSYQGRSKAHIDSSIDDIVDFAELEDFIERPVREYSAGMYARLSFAVATSIEPDILVVDEVLSAGDAYFSGKCIQRMRSITSGGATVLFVSHDASSVQMLCDRCIWMDKGAVLADGACLTVLKAYGAKVREDEEMRLSARSMLVGRKEVQLNRIHKNAYSLFRFIGVDGNPPPKKFPLSVSSIELGQNNNVIARLDAGKFGDDILRFVDDRKFSNWGTVTDVGGRLVRNFADFGGKYGHAPIALNLPNEYAQGGFWLRMECSAEESVHVKFEVYDEGTSNYVELQRIRGRGSRKFFQVTISVPAQSATANARNKSASDEVLSSTERYGSHELAITNFSFLDSGGKLRHTLVTGEAARATIGFRCRQPVAHPVAVIAIYRGDGICALQAVSSRDGFDIGEVSGDVQIEIDFDPLLLGPGDYVVSVALFKSLNALSAAEPDAYDVHDRHYALKIIPPFGVATEFGIVNQRAKWSIKESI